MKALEGKVTHITGAGTPYGDRLDRAPRTSGRWRRGFVMWTYADGIFVTAWFTKPCIVGASREPMSPRAMRVM
jgi:hypothetical protein